MWHEESQIGNAFSFLPSSVDHGKRNGFQCMEEGNAAAQQCTACAYAVRKMRVTRNTIYSVTYAATYVRNAQCVRQCRNGAHVRVKAACACTRMRGSQHVTRVKVCAARRYGIRTNNIWRQIGNGGTRCTRRVKGVCVHTKMLRRQYKAAVVDQYVKNVAGECSFSNVCSAW